MPPKKVFKPTKRPAPVLAEVPAPDEPGAREGEVPSALEAEGSGTVETTTAMHIDPALGATEPADPVSEAAPTTTTTARSGGTAARGIGASMRRSEGAAAGSGTAQGEARGQETRPKVVFKPTVPVKKVKQEQADVKPDLSALAFAAGRGARGGRGRGARGGRGGARGGRAGAGDDRGNEMLASGPFALGPSMANRGSAKNAAFIAADTLEDTSTRIARPVGERKPMFTAQGEEYSDNEGGDRIDMEVVPEEMGESAPTGLIRDRSLKAAGIGAKKQGPGNKGKEDRKPTAQEKSAVVKPEPTSPEQAPTAKSKGKGRARVDDTLLDVDENMDLDESGARLEDEAPVSAQAIDQDDSDEEEVEEDMTGDFALEEGMDDPEDKLYLFQFPEPFPTFLPNPATSYAAKIEQLKAQAVAAAAVKSESQANGILKKNVSFDTDGDVKMGNDKEEGESGGEDKKPSPSEKEKDKAAAREAKQAKAESDARFKKIAEYEKREKERKAEGRIGTLVVTKSGRVKMVLGRDIVMDVTPGVATTFVQQLVHLDKPTRQARVLGEVHKAYVLTPDVDRLLHELHLNDGKVPGEEVDLAVKAEEAGLIKIDG